MTRIVNFLFLLSFSLFFCDSKKKMFAETKEIRKVVLINAGESDRCEISKLIDLIASYQPKVIGINFIFIGSMDCDSLLTNSISNVDNVILVEGFQDGIHVESNKEFTEVAFLTGVTGLSQSSNYLTDHYYEMIDFRGKRELSFPFLLALQSNENRSARIASNVDPNDHPLDVDQYLDNLLIFGFDEISKNKELIKESIVIIGYLGPGDEDIVAVKEGARVQYRTVVIASAIVDILRIN